MTRPLTCPQIINVYCIYIKSVYYKYINEGWQRSTLRYRWCPHPDSDWNLMLSRRVFYPLNYEGIIYIQRCFFVCLTKKLYSTANNRMRLLAFE